MGHIQGKVVGFGCRIGVRGIAQDVAGALPACSSRATRGRTQPLLAHDAADAGLPEGCRDGLGDIAITVDGDAGGQATIDAGGSYVGRAMDDACCRHARRQPRAQFRSGFTQGLRDDGGVVEGTCGPQRAQEAQRGGATYARLLGAVEGLLEGAVAAQ